MVKRIEDVNKVVQVETIETEEKKSESKSLHVILKPRVKKDIRKYADLMGLSLTAFTILCFESFKSEYLKINPETRWKAEKYIEERDMDLIDLIEISLEKYIEEQ